MSQHITNNIYGSLTGSLHLGHGDIFQHREGTYDGMQWIAESKT